MSKPDPLKAYKSKRNFAVTSEPADGGEAGADRRAFVIQKHWASSLHYDFRLELDGTMKSWAIPKGPSFDPTVKRMAVQVEDHPISYNSFEGQIPAGQYGAGKVIIWDKGYWEPQGDPQEGLRQGELKFILHGQKLQGKWVLVRMKGKGEKQTPWLLIKERDAYARPSADYSVVDELPDSVANVTLPAKSATAPSAAPVTKHGSAGTNDSPPAGAVKAALPATLEPELATLVDAAPPGDDWLYEIKFDGYRLLTRIDGGRVRLLTRNGKDWTDKLPHLAAALGALELTSAWLDGEITVMNADGAPDFQALQNAFDSSKTKHIGYYLFDLPYCEGYDLRKVELQQRRAVLKSILERRPAEALHFSDAFEVDATDMLASACHLGLEGIIAKKKSSHYVSRRSLDWVKLKCGQRQEFVIGGYTDPQGGRQGFGALLLGVHDEHGLLHYVGNVGSGFSDKTLAALKQQFDAAASTTSPFAEATEHDGKAHWLQPQLLAEVAFASWTGTGRLRHAVFLGLRSDKKAKNIVRESARHVAKHVAKPVKQALKSALPADLQVSHPERVIDPSTGITKMDLIRFYALVAPLMLPHLKARPVSLVRAPDGIAGGLFFQKHMESGALRGVRLLPPELDAGHAPLMEIVKAEGLLAAAQMNVIEFHTWNAVKSHIDKPDRVTFDLDPGEGVVWAEMQEAATVMRVFLDQLGLKAFIKTSGGKGLHVVVPLKKHYGWEPVKDFSQAIVQHLAQTLPVRFAAKSGPKNRIRKIFIDYLRNGFGATTAAAWSARARPGMGVSVPVAWDELERLTGSAQWSVANIHSRLALGNTPWADYQQSPQSLTPAMKMLGFKPGK